MRPDDPDSAPKWRAVVVHPFRNADPKDIQRAYLSNSSVASMRALFFLHSTRRPDSHLAAATLTADFANCESF